MFKKTIVGLEYEVVNEKEWFTQAVYVLTFIGSTIFLDMG